MKLSRRKDCEQILSVKKDLREVKMQYVGLTASQSIFINKSLCPLNAVVKMLEAS